MRAARNILIAFVLNLAFSVFEFIGGFLTGSVAIISDALHDLGDAVSIGISYMFEKKSLCQPDDRFTYGYIRYSVMGSWVSTFILIIGSAVVMINAVKRILEPVTIHYDGMILFAVIGVGINSVAAYFTGRGHSLNQKAVYLHMLEDVLGWIVVLVGAVVMRFTQWIWLDPAMSIMVAAFIMLNALKNLKAVMEVLLEKTPGSIELNQLKNSITQIDGIQDVHHIHLWSLDGEKVYATMHVVTDCDAKTIKPILRQALQKQGIEHVTLELEREEEDCCDSRCSIDMNAHAGHHH